MIKRQSQLSAIFWWTRLRVHVVAGGCGAVGIGWDRDGDGGLDMGMDKDKNTFEESPAL